MELLQNKEFDFHFVLIKRSSEYVQKEGTQRVVNRYKQRSAQAQHSAVEQGSRDTPAGQS